MPLELIFLPLLGALIGWLTNRIAIRLLFYPRRPWGIPLLGWELQGLLPKRRVELARAVGEAVERELLSTEDLIHYLTQPHFQAEINEKLATAAADRFEHRVPAFIPRNFRGLLTGFIRDFTHREMGAIIRSTLARLKENVELKPFIGTLLENRLLEIDLDDLEKLITHIAGKELIHIEVVGGILGFIIGIFQAGLVMLVN